MTRRGPGSGVLAPVVVMAAFLAMAVAIVSWGLAHTGTSQPATSAAALAGDGYVLWDLRSDGSPVRWDPCTDVTWTTRPTDPAWLPTVTSDALATLAVHTGLGFRHVESDDVDVGPTRTLTDGAGTWRPVLVTLTTPDESQWLADADRALALPVTIDGQFVTGQVLLQADSNLTADRATRDGSWGATLMHEWGHMIGLDHTDDPMQLMHGVALSGAATWGDGDLRGFAELARDPTCLPPPRGREADLPTPRRR